MNKTLLTIAAGSALVAGLIAANTADAHEPSARATLTTATGTEIGTVEFRTHKGHTEVRVRLEGAPGPTDAFHGFHIHANDDASLSPGNGVGCVTHATDPTKAFLSADGHFNPTDPPAVHGDHVGDMPVQYVNSDGSVESRFRIDAINPADLDNRVVILHAGADNYNNIPLGELPTQYTDNGEAAAATAKTGNAGNRAACGVIHL